MALIDNLVSYWKLDEASGSALDAHSTNNLTDNGSVSSAAGKINDARSFTPGSSQYFSLADNADLSIGGGVDFTIQAWVRIADKSVTRSIVSKWTGASDYEYVLYYDHTTDKFSLYVTSTGSFGGPSQLVTDDVTGTLSVDTWYLVHTWHDATNSLLGISVNAGTASTVSWTYGVDDGSAAFKIGSHDGGNYWSGRIDEVALWKRVLTSGERTSLYNSSNGLAYPFSAGSGSPHNYYAQQQ